LSMKKNKIAKMIELKQVFSPEAPLARMEGDVSTFNRICMIYLKQTPELLRLLEKALMNGEKKEARRLAHSLKSSSANAGCMEMHAMAEIMEISLMKKIEPGCAEKLVLMKQAFSVLETRVLEYLEK
jgi:HPt (histidine-containing phosphotransfer) domain-containing protein